MIPIGIIHNSHTHYIKCCYLLLSPVMYGGLRKWGFFGRVARKLLKSLGKIKNFEICGGATRRLAGRMRAGQVCGTIAIEIQDTYTAIHGIDF